MALAAPTNGLVHWVAIDIEAWEREHAIITEVGLSRTTTVGQFGVSLLPGESVNLHWVVEENESKRNGTFVPDERHNFLHGVTETRPLAEIVSIIKVIFERLQATGRVVLTGHALSGDLKWLESAGLDLTSIIQIDTQKVWRSMEREDQPRSLFWVCEEMGIPCAGLHNAGNDSKYTLDVILAMGAQVCG